MRTTHTTLTVAALLLGLAGGATARGTTPAADVALASSAAAITQTDVASWTLEKTGRTGCGHLNAHLDHHATAGAVRDGQMLLDGVLDVTNRGLGPATIGNIVAHLQTRSGKTWVTRVSDVADATQGDGATSVLIDRHASSEGLGRFSEGPGSGTLHLMDAAGNSLFSRTEEPTVAPGATVSLLFSAAFDNAVLNLADGTRVRLEVLASFGNAARAKGCIASLDINGNGTIDPDEAWVRSLAARTGLAVPPPRSATDEPVLADSAADIATTGTVTYSDPVFDLGATEGSVSMQVDGGTTGGTITNCAHLTAPATTTTVGGHAFPNGDDLELVACDTQEIGATSACSPGCGWHDGDVITYSQLDWGDPTNKGGALVTSWFDTVYALDVWNRDRRAVDSVRLDHAFWPQPPLCLSPRDGQSWCIYQARWWTRRQRRRGRLVVRCWRSS